MSRDLPPLHGLDLNLLVTLRALLREGGVTRAAQRLGQTQPSVSRALATLRAAFDDALLVRTGRGMSLTPLAVRLLPDLERSLASIDRLLGSGPFVPATTERSFRLVMPDLLGVLVAPRLAVRLMEEAPRSALRLDGHEGDAARRLLEDQVDLVVGARSLEHPELFGRRVEAAEMTWSVVWGPLHGTVTGTMDLETWASSGQVVLAPGGRPELPGVLDRPLAEAGVRRSVRFHSSHLAAIGPVVAATDWVASLPTPVARFVASGSGLRVGPHPLAHLLPTLSVRLTWHELHHGEPGHVWIRQVVAEVVRQALTAAG